MIEDSVDDLRRRLERELAARREAESLLDCKSRELHLLNRDLTQALARLELTLEERTQALVDLRTVAYLDSLTGLANRRLFQQRLAEAIRQSEHDEQGFTLLFIDTDDFKRVNDTYGHASGDDVLRHIAGRLLETVREVDTVARIAGDEFAILLPGLVEHETIASLSRRVIQAVNEPVAPRQRHTQDRHQYRHCRLSGRRSRHGCDNPVSRPRDVSLQAGRKEPSRVL